MLGSKQLSHPCLSPTKPQETPYPWQMDIGSLDLLPTDPEYKRGILLNVSFGIPYGWVKTFLRPLVHDIPLSSDWFIFRDQLMNPYISGGINPLQQITRFPGKTAQSRWVPVIWFHVVGVFSPELAKSLKVIDRGENTLGSTFTPRWLEDGKWIASISIESVGDIPVPAMWSFTSYVTCRAIVGLFRCFWFPFFGGR